MIPYPHNWARSGPSIYILPPANSSPHQRELHHRSKDEYAQQEETTTKQRDRNPGETKSLIIIT